MFGVTAHVFLRLFGSEPNRRLISVANPDGVIMDNIQNEIARVFELQRANRWKVAKPPPWNALLN